MRNILAYRLSGVIESKDVSEDLSDDTEVEANK